MKTSAVFAALFMAFGLAACSTVSVTSTTFQGDRAASRGTLAVRPLNASQASSLEFKSAADQLLADLLAKGYTMPAEGQPPDFVAYLSYGIDTGRTVYASVPIYGQTGGGTTYLNGSSSDGSSFTATATTMPTYGVVGSSTISGRLYRRSVAVDIYDAKATPPKKQFEMRGVSEGSCGQVSPVLPYILDGMMKNFPGVSGRTSRTISPIEGRPC